MAERTVGSLSGGDLLSNVTIRRRSGELIRVERISATDDRGVTVCLHEGEGAFWTSGLLLASTPCTVTPPTVEAADQAADGGER